MPYGKRRGANGWTVYNLLTGRVYGRGMTKANADQQLVILRASDRRGRGKKRKR